MGGCGQVIINLIKQSSLNNTNSCKKPITIDYQEPKKIRALLFQFTCLRAIIGGLIYTIYTGIAESWWIIMEREFFNIVSHTIWLTTLISIHGLVSKPIGWETASRDMTKPVTTNNMLSIFTANYNIVVWIQILIYHPSTGCCNNYLGNFCHESSFCVSSNLWFICSTQLCHI